ncbi:helix-turn-helix domain-containing protein [Anaerosalibacter sp. Marseille-P3206]|uniref:helix-turn-helix domain-containing protein n=1 Tax=Anaerosalibacter sp. Marseille-P3206 TaxID=1871005 RepID=UPI0009872A25|nr:helix-turn-helix transcriptional regulator [Anaerosalibacter sp. Marseille-P3206]
MKNNTLITIGQNLRRIRKELNLRQSEITGGEITRNLISLIENNKTPLSETNAKIISQNMNLIMKERGLDIYIETEDILNPKRYDAKKKADLYIQQLQNYLNEKNYNIETEKLQEIELFLNNWNLNDKKVKIYELLGDIFYYSSESNKEFIYLTKALECSFMFSDIKSNYKLISKLVSNCINTGKYQEAITLGNLGLLSNNDMIDEHKGIFHYNNALAYKNLNQFDKSLEELVLAKKLINNTNNKTLKKIMTLEALCYSNKKNYNKALSIYKELLEISDNETNSDELCLIYTNIIDMFIKNNDIPKVIEHLNILNKYIPNVNENSSYLAKIYFEMSNAYYFLEDYDLTMKYLENSLVISKKNNQKNLFSKVLLKIFELSTKTNNTVKINLYIEKIKENLIDIDIDDKTKLLLNLVLYYLDNGYNSLVKELIQEILNK